MKITEAPPTTEQNVPTTAGGASLPPGMSTDVGRSPSCQVTGSVQRDLAAGPSGPLFGPLCRSPQRPANRSQASGSCGPLGASGSSTTRGTTRVDGSWVLSQPNPSE